VETTSVSFLKTYKDEITLVLSMCAILISIVAFTWQWIKERQARKKAIFLALQDDRKSVADVTMRVINGKSDVALKKSGPRKELIQALAITLGLEGSDRGKSYVLAALEYVAGKSPEFRQEVIDHLKGVEQTFEAYVRTGADEKFHKKRLKPLQAILKAIAGPVSPHSSPATASGQDVRAARAG
jgi:hypothetical protein